MQAFEQDGMYSGNRVWNLCAEADFLCTGTIQRSQGASSNRKSCEGFPKVLVRCSWVREEHALWRLNGKLK